MDIAQLFPSKDLASKGVWTAFYPPTANGEQSFEYLVTYNYQAYNDQVQKRIVLMRRELEGRNLSASQLAEIQTRSLVGTVLLDWRGVEQDGKTLPFSEEAAFQLMTAYPPFENAVRQIGSDVRTFQAEMGCPCSQVSGVQRAPPAKVLRQTSS